MAKQVWGIGTSANDGTGDTLRVGIDKANDNFNELYGYASIGAMSSVIPTNAELVAVLGAAATNGAGWSKTVYGTNGGDTFYFFVKSTGTGYIYSAMTLAV